MLLGGYKNTTGRWDKTPGGPGIPFLSSFVIIGNADVTHGNGTEASDFDMRIGAEASHYFWVQLRVRLSRASKDQHFDNINLVQIMPQLR
ncbi:unnamed protein product [Rhizophagus irregularis]|nr:unnamed protein product [Rhizophagus irregularis]